VVNILLFDVLGFALLVWTAYRLLRIYRAQQNRAYLWIFLGVAMIVFGIAIANTVSLFMFSGSGNLILFYLEKVLVLLGLALIVLGTSSSALVRSSP
jgi:hypothetical protein